MDSSPTATSIPTQPQHTSSRNSSDEHGGRSAQSPGGDVFAYSGETEHDDEDYTAPMLPPLEAGNGRDGDPHQNIGLSRKQAWNLYLSHALSTWNARGYEFAAVLFTAAAYPGTLVAASSRMIIIYFAMIIFSSSIGSWVDRSPSRLRTLLTTIVCNRGSVIVGSLFWLAILSQRDLLLNEPTSEGRDGHGSTSGPLFALPADPTLKAIGFALAITCGIVERLSASGNLLSMERDWVPTVAAAAARDGNPYDLTHLNAVMRRIDLVCKLFSPIMLSLVISFSGSTRVGVLFTGLTSALCIPVEILSARSVWRGNPALQQPRPNSRPASNIATRSSSSSSGSNTTSVPGLAAQPSTSLRQRITTHIVTLPRDFAKYFTSSPSSVWIPSLALAILHFNMLTWRATFITYLLTVGYSLNVITAARTAGSLFEISSTVVTPWLIVVLGRAGISHVGRARRPRSGGRRREDSGEVVEALLSAGPREEDGSVSRGGVEFGVDDQGYEEGGGSTDRQTLVGLQRVALWGITWQVVNTIPVVLAIWAITADSNPPPTSPSLAATSTTTTTPAALTLINSLVLFTFLSLSRLGVWVYDLATQQLTTTLVPPAERSSFVGVEGSMTNIFELAGAVASIALPEPRQYPWLASASLAACVVSWGLYAGWLRRRRGHLVHYEKVARVVRGEACFKGKR